MAQENQMKKAIYDALCIELGIQPIQVLKEGNRETLKGFTAQGLADHFQVSRNLISHYLNQLFAQDLVFKFDSRPVYYFPRKAFLEQFHLEALSRSYTSLLELMEEITLAEGRSASFSLMIGANESLSYCIEQCKAAISYPGQGLPILLNGPTGTGKSMLASCMYEYAKETGRIQPDARFVTVNCAEYANNPELLLTNLFGYKKGAYTGADKDRQGLIAAAEGGVLFLDEVHALKPESQEKIFLFMDKGIYHMVGDNDTWYEGSVRMIFATTEDPKTCLLKTMLRRIPITVKLPSLKQRSRAEKKELIAYLFKREAKAIHQSIRISKLAYQVMESVDYLGNVGELKNYVKASVAKALLHRGDTQDVEIHIYDLPSELLDMQRREVPQAQFDDHTMIDLEVMEDEKRNSQLYQFNLSILRSFSTFPNKESNFPAFAYSMHERIEQYIDDLYYSEEEKDSPNSKFVYNLLSNIFQIIASKYHLEKVSNNETIILSRLIMDYLNHATIRKAFSHTLNQELNQCLELIKTYYPLDYSVAVDVAALIEDALHLHIGRIGQINVFLFFHYFDRDMKKAAIPGIIIAHGYNIASSIAEVVNQLLNRKVFDAIDMPIESDFTLVVSRLREYLLQKEGCREFIVMVDMGSLEDIYAYLENVSNVDLGIINNVSTKLALDIGSMILDGNSIDQILEEASIRNQHRYKIISNRKKQNTILTVCETGIGTAEKIASLIEQSLPQAVDIKIIPYDYASLSTIGIHDPIFQKCNVIGIVGTKDPQIGICFISIEELLEQKHLDTILAIFAPYLDEKQITVFNENMIKYFSMDHLLGYLTILDTEKIMDSVQDIIAKLQKGLQIVFPAGVVMGLYVHIACLIERLIIDKQAVYYEDVDKFTAAHPDFIKLVKTIFADVERIYNVEIPVNEIAYIYAYIYHRPVKSVNRNENSVNDFENL